MSRDLLGDACDLGGLELDAEDPFVNKAVSRERPVHGGNAFSKLFAGMDPNGVHFVGRPSALSLLDPISINQPPGPHTSTAAASKNGTLPQEMSETPADTRACRSPEASSSPCSLYRRSCRQRSIDFATIPEH